MPSNTLHSLYAHSRLSFQYGDPTNTSRPGGPLVSAQFQSLSSSDSDPSLPSTVLRVIADNSSTFSIIDSVTRNCTSYLRPLSNSSSTTVAIPDNLDTNSTSTILPDHAIQYYRASSVVLTLDGYNNTAALGNVQGLPQIILPDWVDIQFLDCVNVTIGESVPLVDVACQRIIGIHLIFPVVFLLIQSLLELFIVM